MGKNKTIKDFGAEPEKTDIAIGVNPEKAPENFEGPTEVAPVVTEEVTEEVTGEATAPDVVPELPQEAPQEAPPQDFAEQFSTLGNYGKSTPLPVVEEAPSVDTEGWVELVSTRAFPVTFIHNGRQVVVKFEAPDFIAKVPESQVEFLLTKSYVSRV